MCPEGVCAIVCFAKFWGCHSRCLEFVVGCSARQCKMLLFVCLHGSQSMELCFDARVAGAARILVAALQAVQLCVRLLHRLARSLLVSCIGSRM